MGHVEVAAGHHGLLGGKAGQKLAVAGVPGNARVNARELGLGVGRVDVHEPIVLELERADAALGDGHGHELLFFGREHLVGDGRQLLGVKDAQRLLAREDGRAGVALALGVAPGLEVAGKLQLKLALLQLGLLDGEDVGIQRLKDLGEARLLLHDGAKPVDVPRDEPELAFV